MQIQIHGGHNLTATVCNCIVKISVWKNLTKIDAYAVVVMENRIKRIISIFDTKCNTLYLQLNKIVEKTTEIAIFTTNFILSPFDASD